MRLPTGWAAEGRLDSALRVLLYFLLLAQAAAWLVTLQPRISRPDAGEMGSLPPATLGQVQAPVVAQPTDWSTVHKGLAALERDPSLSPSLRAALLDLSRQLPRTGPVDPDGYRRLEPVLARLSPGARRVLAGACP